MVLYITFKKVFSPPKHDLCSSPPTFLFQQVLFTQICLTSSVILKMPAIEVRFRRKSPAPTKDFPVAVDTVWAGCEEGTVWSFAFLPPPPPPPSLVPGISCARNIAVLPRLPS
jgi:hypothetical protein